MPNTIDYKDAVQKKWLVVFKVLLSGQLGEIRITGHCRSLVLDHINAFVNVVQSWSFLDSTVVDTFFKP